MARATSDKLRALGLTQEPVLGKRKSTYQRVPDVGFDTMIASSTNAFGAKDKDATMINVALSLAVVAATSGAMLLWRQQNNNWRVVLSF